MKQEPFVIEHSFQASVGNVWKAITDREQMTQWYFGIEEFKPEVGFEFTFNGENEGRVFVHLCKITEVTPNRKLSYSWRYKDYEGVSYVTFELFPDGDKTILRLTHEGLETFPLTNKDFARQNFVDGWTYIVGTSLKNFLENMTIRKEVEIKASPTEVWSVLVEPPFNRQWAAQFSEGAYVETDWQQGSAVVWKDKNGNIGAKGKVIVNDSPTLLHVSFYDDVNADAATPPGRYSEVYSIREDNGKTWLSVEVGPLNQKEGTIFLPLWDKALHKMKELAEDPTRP